MDIIKEIKNERKYTFHSHTQFCDGHATMEEMAIAAISEEFRFYGFSPHSPIPIPSPCNMKSQDVEEYLNEVKHIQIKYANRGCQFYAGMEIDYLGKEWGPALPYFNEIGLDFSIGSVHFIPSQSGDYIDIDGSFDNFKKKMLNNFRRDIDYVVDTFFLQSIDMINAGGFDILGHFDKVGQNASYYAPGIEDGTHYRSLMDEIVDLIIQKKTLIEINTKARQEHGRFFPNEKYWKKLVDSGVPIIVNSDAHRPDRISASRAEAFELLDNMKIQEASKVL